MYLVMSVNKTVDVDVYGLTHVVPLSFGEGMIGAMPVFGTKEQAEKFANGEFDVLELQEHSNGQAGAEG